MLTTIDIAPLFDGASSARKGVDQTIARAASSIGFLQVTGLPDPGAIDRESRAALKEIFDLPREAQMALSRVNFDPSASAIYRGWYPLQPGVRSYKQGIDIGPDIAHANLPMSDDVLREPTPLPDLPEWRAAGKRWYLAMETVGEALMRAIARILGVSEDEFAPLFEHGISSFRLAHYPVRSPDSFGGEDPKAAEISHMGEVMHLSGVAHVDSGFITLLVQDGVPGLQVQIGNDWVDAPPTEGAIVVNFGKLLDRWSGGAIKATRHRVVSRGEERVSFPFFYEPAPDAVIGPLPIKGATQFEPFYYGDHLWEATTQFVEQKGVKHLRQPLGRPAEKRPPK